MYRYILHESCSQFDSLPLTSLTILHDRYSLALLDTMAKSSAGSLLARGWRGGSDAAEARAHANASADRVGLARALQVYGLHGVLDTCVRAWSREGAGAGGSGVGGRERSELRAIQYATASRLSCWGDEGDARMPMVDAGGSGAAGFGSVTLHSSIEPSLYHAMRALHSGDKAVFSDGVARAEMILRRQLAQCLGGVHASSFADVEDMANVSPVLNRLEILRDMRAVWTKRWAAARAPGALGALTATKPLATLVPQWANRALLLHDEWELLEPLLATRTALMRAAGDEAGLRAQLLSVARLSRRAGRGLQAIDAMHQMRPMCAQLQRAAAGRSARVRVGSDPGAAAAAAALPVPAALPNCPERLLWLIEEARCLWSIGEQQRAVDFLRQTLRSSQAEAESGAAAGGGDSSGGALTRQMQLLVGQWLTSTKSESSEKIIERFLEPAGHSAWMSSDRGGGAPRAAVAGARVSSEACYALASYYDRLYQQQEAHISSPEWKQWMAAFQAKGKQVAAYKEQLKKAKDKGHRTSADRAELKHLNVQVSRSTRALDTMRGFNMGDEQIADEYLRNTLEWYGRCLRLKSGQQRDMTIVFRICALWFKNAKNDATNTSVQALSKVVPTQKWVRLMYQIVSRLGGEDSTDGHKQALNALVVRTANDHPHHCVPLLIALRNANGYAPPKKSRRQKTAPSSVVISKGVAHSKILAATAALRAISGSSKVLATVCKQWEAYAGAHIKLAAVAKELKDKKIKRVQFAQYLDKAAGPFASEVPVDMVVPTRELAVRADCDYTTAPTVVEYDRSIKVTTSGITYPIIVKSRASDGRAHRHIVKADDTRTDAVMQQAFHNVNALLRNTHETQVSVLLCTVTFYANLAHSLTRSP